MTESVGGGSGAPFAMTEGQVFALLDTAPVGYLAVDAASGSVRYINQTLCRALGRRPSEIVGTEVGALFVHPGDDAVRRLVGSAPDASTGTATGAVEQVWLEDGARLSVLLMANTERGESTSTVRITVLSAADPHDRGQAFAEARDVGASVRTPAATARESAVAALDRSQDARKSAESEHTQVQMLATTLQRSLLPPIVTAPPGMDVAAYYHHAVTEVVGGDFYDLFPLDAHTWGFFLGDVSGKGPGAAAATSLTRYSLRAAAVFDRDPVTVLSNLNTVLRHEFLGDDPRFCTVVYGTVSPGADGTASVELASGGHPPALLLRAHGDAEYIHTTGGQLVGAIAEPRFTSARVELSAGDVLVLYTDGLTEARVGPGRARYDDDGALERFARTASPSTAAGFVAALVGLLDSFGSGVEDDVALLALSVPAKP
ncbi:MAG: SpoIIE family protein phosphatase [Rhodococcus sp. (in: high G+C Gram-positive bacteria)]|nr:SpoIIE family protein phosphatase [Rhodococcus sp. (in: high G+C Gram-positive bacteria)]